MRDFSDYKFHPSSLGKLMTDSKIKSDPLGETCKSFLLEIWVQETYGRRKEITSKYLEKGILVEDDGISLYSLEKKQFYKKNTEVISNEWFIGTPDIFEGEEIMKATSVKDIKSSWDIFTFFQTIASPINKQYRWQLNGYGSITGAKELSLVYCLVDTPEHLIHDEKQKLMWRMGVSDPAVNEDYQKRCAQIEKNMTFSDIPRSQRWIEFVIERDEDMIQAAIEKVKLARVFLNALNKALLK